MTSFVKISVCLLGLLLVPMQAVSAKLSPEDLEKKRHGWYPTGIPMANYTSNAGFGYGLRVYGYNNGVPTDPYFNESPYFMQVFAQFFQTTLGQSYHRVELDMPFLAGSEYRLRSIVEYVGILNANFYGASASDADRGLVGADDNTYDNLSDLTEHLESGDPSASLRRFNNYQRRKIYGMVRVSRPILDWVEIDLGLEFGFVDIKDWHKRTDEFNGVEETYAPTRLTLASESPDFVGAEGGWVNVIHFGLRVDERDFEPNPKAGYLAEYNLVVSGKFLGASTDFVRQTWSVRGFHTFWDRLTFAGRLAMSYASGDVPFFELGKMNFIKGSVTALGGPRTNRGFVQERFLARGYTLAQLDVRYTVGDIVVWGERFGFQPFAFLDLGNVYDRFDDIFTKPRFGDYRPSYGGGFMIPWNLATVLHVFVGMSSEGMTVSMDFDHAF